MTTPAHDAVSLVVGVTSHRDLVPAELPALRTWIRSLLDRLRREFPDLGLTILSPLAEGGDRLVAEAGLRIGAHLVAPLPFPAATYAQDFHSDDSRREFEDLLAAAEVIEMRQPADVSDQAMALPGPLRDHQYAQAGLYVANHCHLLIALWDGRPSPLTGGTAQIVDYYLGGAAPGARRARDRIRQMLSGDDDSLVFHIPAGRVEPTVASTPDATGATWLTSFGRSPGEGPIPKDFRELFTRMQDFERDHHRYAAQMPPTVPGESRIGCLHRAADWLAIHFQRRMTFAMQSTYVLAALMGFAFLLYSDIGAPEYMLFVFLFLFAAGVLIALTAQWRDWHRKYIDYRALAEGLRVQSYWRRAGISTTSDPEFAHDNFLQKQDVELGWIRNVMRFAGVQVPSHDASEDPAAVAEEWVGRPDSGGQLAWYARKAAEHERRHRLTQRIGAACLWIGIGISAFLALLHAVLNDDTQDRLVMAMGMLSITAAVREAYSYRKADKELVKQYRFMHRIYRNARAALDDARSPGEQRDILRSLGEAALAEHAEWALMHRERPLEHGRL